MFLDNIDRIFYGTGDKNENGETFEEFLEKYNPDLYEKPSCTVDMIVIRCDGRLERFDQKKQILLIKRKKRVVLRERGEKSRCFPRKRRVFCRERRRKAARAFAERRRGFLKILRLGVKYIKTSGERTENIRHMLPKQENGKNKDWVKSQLKRS